VKNHLSLNINESTAASDVISFLRQADFQERAGRKFNVRAVEKTYTASNGNQTTVKILFVRSGRETPFEWFANLWNRKSQYALAAKVLSYGLFNMPRYRNDVHVEPGVHPDLRRSVFQIGLKHRRDGVPVSTFKDLFASH
jgi:hypothetical protein